MTPAARVAAAIEILDQVLAGSAAEKALTGWGRAHRFAGSGDRAALRDLVFDALRCRSSLAALGGALSGRGLMIGALRRDGIDLATIFSGQGHAPPLVQPGEAPALGPLSDHVRLDIPDWLFALFSDALGPGANQALQALQSRAPLFLRVNLRCATPERALAVLADDGIAARPHPKVKTALEVIENERRLQKSAAFLEGLVEVQDAASQAAVLRLALPVGGRVLDYCAGGGGKSLAIAALADHTLFAYDVDPRRMTDLPQRAARAGVRIEQVDAAALAGLGPFDLVLVDAPCSGSGTWRRNPEAKWQLTPDRLADLARLQAQILSDAAALVSPGGCLAYATCSVLTVENDAQIRQFLARAAGFSLLDRWSRSPDADGDGFFLAQMCRN